MRQLLPLAADAVDADLAHAQAERPTPAGRPWVMLNMVASVDGATAVDGVSGGLGGDADRHVFRALRAVADVILVAAGTVRAEGYGPPRTSEARQAQRAARGQPPHPRIAIVSGSLDLDPTAPVLAEAPEPVLVLTGERAPIERIEAVAAVAEVRQVGATAVDLAAALALLGRLGHRTVLCEGGPTLNGQLLDADLVDEIDLTLSPTLVGGDALRVAVGGRARAHRVALAHLWHDPDDDLLFARYVRR
ncbi:MAG: pyrimidine reductase family protein [Acidimicrobiales bacterium]